MAWDTDLVLMTRVLISDITAPQKYSDEYLQRVLVTAGIIVDAKVTFPYDYTYDISEITISPDPVTSEDSAFMALVPLKSACIITQGEFKQALGQGIKVRDGDSAIDTSVSFRGYRDILEFGPCAAYQRLEWSLLASGGNGLVGKAVFGPFRESGGTGLNTISWYYDWFSGAINGRRDR
jgi:hypothetical protein